METETARESGQAQMMMTMFITEGGEGLGKTNKKKKLSLSVRESEWALSLQSRESGRAQSSVRESERAQSSVSMESLFATPPHPVPGRIIFGQSPPVPCFGHSHVRRA